MAWLQPILLWLSYFTGHPRDGKGWKNNLVVIRLSSVDLVKSTKMLWMPAKTRTGASDGLLLSYDLLNFIPMVWIYPSYLPKVSKLVNHMTILEPFSYVLLPFWDQRFPVFTFPFIFPSNASKSRYQSSTINMTGVFLQKEKKIVWGCVSVRNEY